MSSTSCTQSQRGSFAGTAMTLASPPASSVMLNTPTGRTVDADAGEQLVVEQHQHVDRVAVVAERVLDVAVVRGVAERRVEHAVEEHPPGLVVDLVLDAAALRDLDEGGVVGHGVPSRSDSMRQ